MGARSTVWVWKRTPGIGLSTAFTASKAGRRRVMTGTKLSGLEAAMAARTRVGSAPVVRCRVARGPVGSPRREGTTPMVTTGVGVRRGTPLRSRTGDRSKLERSGVRPVFGPVTVKKSWRLTSAALAQNSRSSCGPQRAHSS